MVHGIAHSFGAIFNMAHGLTNAVILPYALRYNSSNEVVKEKIKELSYHCKCKDFIYEVEKLAEELNIPKCFKDAGISEEAFLAKKDKLVEHSMMGATKVNPVEITKEEMKKLIPLVYYGENK